MSAAGRAARADLADDLAQLAWLAREGSGRMRALGRRSRAAKPHLPPDAGGLAERWRAGLVASLADAGRRAAHARRSALAGRGRLDDLEAEARALTDLTRAHRAAMAAVAEATEWTSPSSAHAVRSRAGRRTGRVAAGRDDYVRDRHPDGAAYERAWAAARLGRAGPRAWLTAGGMAAVTTALAYLGAEGALARGALVGRRAYHETRGLLTAWPGPHREVDEADAWAVVRAARARRPGVVVLDALSNTHEVLMTDVCAVLDGLADGSAGEVHLLVDVTARPDAARELFARLAGRTAWLRLVVVESLTKYAQLGLDRLAAGVVAAEGGRTVQLDAWREHLGTGLPPGGVAALPWPSGEALARRLARLDRNAAILAHRLAAAVPAVAHPALAGHPSHARARGLAFRGGYVGVGLADPAGAAARVLALARARGIPLCAGAGFGLDVTRLTVVAGPDPPFLRVSAGAEHRPGAEAVAGVVAEALARRGRILRP